MKQQKLTNDEKKNILQFLTEEYELNMQDLKNYREHLAEVYEATNVISKSEDKYINFANNVLNFFPAKVMTRIPKISVKAKKTDFFPWEEEFVWIDRDKIKERNNIYAKAIDDFLNVTFRKNNIYKTIKSIVKSMWAYGRAYSIISTWYNKKWFWKDLKILNKFPKIEQISTESIIFDPNYKNFSEIPWYFIKKSAVRLNHIKMAKNNFWASKYFDLENLEKLTNEKFENSDNFSSKIFEITWIDWIKADRWLDKNSLDLIIYEGYYSLSWKVEDERLYEITTVNNLVIIWFEEIENFSVKAIDCFEDLEVWIPHWIIAPILELQKDINFQKIAKKKIIKRKMNGKYYWDPMSWVNPNDILGDNPLIVTSMWLKNALEWVSEFAYNDLPHYYFSDINDMQRDFQKLTFTVDVTQAQGQTALTNTATGAKISFYEANTVIADIRENIKYFFSDLAYQILDWVYHNIEDKVDIKNLEEKEISIDKEVFRDALERYEIIIETWTMWLDSQAENRENAIALKNILLEAMQAWVPVDAVKAYEQLFLTFEWIEPDSFMKKQEQVLQEQNENQIPKWWNNWQIQNTWPAEMTNSILAWAWVEIPQ